MSIMRTIKMFGKVNDVKTRQHSNNVGYYIVKKLDKSANHAILIK